MFETNLQSWLVPVGVFLLATLLGFAYGTFRFRPIEAKMRDERDRLVRELSLLANGAPASGEARAAEFEKGRAELNRVRIEELRRQGVRHAIFVGYRREDSADVAGRIYDRLEEKFGRGSVFKDVDSIKPGIPFAEYITSIIPECRVFLALVGSEWLNSLKRREGAEDYVLIELELALASEALHVIPVLIGNAAMPPAQELPSSIASLAKRHAARVRPDPDFRGDMTKLIGVIEERSGRDVS